jgi:two-component system, NarL family, sensor kinase
MINNDIILATVISTLLIFLLLAIILVIAFWSGRKKAELERQLVDSKLRFEKEIRQVESEVSEHMMTNFARELHDNIGQLVTALGIHAENLKLSHPEMNSQLTSFDIYLSEISQQLRLLSKTLNHDFLGDVGLLGAIGVEVERLKSLRRFQIHYEVKGDDLRLDKNRSMMIFRIFQEVVQNVLRHSRAKNMYITCNASSGLFVLELRDDGIGFDKGQLLASPKGTGLRNILKRSELAGFECEVITKPGEGSTYIFKTRQENR